MSPSFSELKHRIFISLFDLTCFKLLLLLLLLLNEIFLLYINLRSHLILSNLKYYFNYNFLLAFKSCET